MPFLLINKVASPTQIETYISKKAITKFHFLDINHKIYI